MKIAVAGTGYVGLSIATLLAQKHEVVAVDVIPEKVEKINAKQSPIADEFLEKYLAEKPLDLRATLDGREAYRGADYVVIATPTNYDPKKNFFDTSHVEEVIDLVLEVNPDAVMVIKSTIPVGYTRNVREKFSYRERQADGTMKVVVPKILFAPEFLRESKALYDNLYPSRIIVGYDEMPDQVGHDGRSSLPAATGNLAEAAHTFAHIIAEGALKEDVPVLFMGSTEAEAVKLFANTYLALRVSYFNELDTYAEMKGLEAATACRRTRSSSWRTSTTCRRTSSRPSWTPTAPARTTSRTACWRRRATTLPPAPSIPRRRRRSSWAYTASR